MCLQIDLDQVVDSNSEYKTDWPNYFHAIMSDELVAQYT